MFLLAIEWGGDKFAWSSPTIIGLFCGSFATMVAFAVWEYHRGEDAMIPRHIISQRIVLCGCATVFFQLGSLLLLIYYLPVWFQVVLGVSPIESGIHTLPTIISQITGGMLQGTLSKSAPSPLRSTGSY